MILDGALLFDSAHAITAAGGTEASTNVIDWTQARDMGIGDQPALKVLVQVIQAFAGGTSLAVKMQGSTDNSAWSDMPVATPTALTLGNLTAGARLLDVNMPRPGSGQAIPRYLRLLYTTVGTHTLGTVTAALVLDRQDYIAYPAGINIQN